MKNLVAILFCTLNSLILIGQVGCETFAQLPFYVPPPCPTTDWYLIFEDDFNTLDHSIWDTKLPGSAPAERLSKDIYDPNSLDKQVYLDQNVSTANGKLILTVQEEEHLYEGVCGIDEPGPPYNCGLGDDFSYTLGYTSGAAYMKNGFYAKEPLRIDAKIKLPSGSGLFPAFWVWVPNSEIDFFEFFTTPTNTFRLSFHNTFGERVICNKDFSGDFFDDAHVWSARLTEQDFQLFIDDEHIHTFPQYQSWLFNGQNNIPIECEGIIPPTIVRNFTYPQLDTWYAPIFNVAVDPRDTPSGLPSTMEIDYVKIFRQNYCNHDFKDLVVSEDTYLWSSSDNIYNRIIVQNGATLNIKGELRFTDLGGITVKDESKLVIEGYVGSEPANELFSILDAYCDEWEGIEIEYGSTIEVKHKSTIKNARVGIRSLAVPVWESNAPSYNDIWIQSVQNILDNGNPSIRIIEESVIEDCRIGLVLPNYVNNVEINGAKFNRNGKGIAGVGSNGATITKTIFEDNDEAIVVADSKVKIIDSNKILSSVPNQNGFKAFGTFPLATALQVTGSQNEFNNVKTGIKLRGVEDPSGAQITNCMFEENNIAIDIEGATKFDIEENIFRQGNFGIDVWDSGDNTNRIKCNAYIDQEISNLAFVGSNTKTTFRDNSFDSTQDFNVKIANAELAPFIGSSVDAAGNCFGTKEVVVTNVLPNAQASQYFYFSAPCQIPDPTGNFSIAPSILPSNTSCAGGGTPPPPPFDPATPPPTAVGPDVPDDCNKHKNCIKEYIVYQINEKIVTLGGDDLFSDINESKGELSYELYKWIEARDYWINESLRLGLKEYDTDWMENLLSSLKNYYWKKRYFGLLVLQKKFDIAAHVLEQLPTETQEQNNFKRIQEINLKRLRLELIEHTEYQELEQFARMNLPSAGYAQSICYLLTGDEISNKSDKGKSKNHHYTSNHRQLIIYPNPANDKIVIVDNDLIEFYIYDNNAILVKIVKNTGGYINISDLANGTYFIMESKAENSLRRSGKLVILR